MLTIKLFLAEKKLAFIARVYVKEKVGQKKLKEYLNAKHVKEPLSDCVVGAKNTRKASALINARRYQELLLKKKR